MSIGVCGTAYKWFESYLSERTYFVQIQDQRSENSTLHRGVPQGSVLGPLLFIVYLLPLGNIFRHYGIQFHSYADDTQLYVSTSPTASLPPNGLTACLHDIQAWMTQNYLKLNSNKTEVLLIGTTTTLQKNDIASVSVGDDVIPVSKHVKSLGVILDSTLSFSNHISNVCRTAFFHLRNISRLRPALTQHSAEVLVNSLVTSRIDYCNAILSGIPKKLTHHLHLVQNSAARIITGSKSSDHVTPLLLQLHWLPIPQRITFKILLITFKAIHNLAPSYVKDLLQIYSPSRSLRSSNAGLLVQPDILLNTMGARAFSYAAPKLWNSLPSFIHTQDSVSQFKSALKTHLFKLAYEL